MAPSARYLVLQPPCMLQCLPLTPPAHTLSLLTLYFSLGQKSCGALRSHNCQAAASSSSHPLSLCALHHGQQVCVHVFVCVSKVFYCSSLDLCFRSIHLPPLIFLSPSLPSFSRVRISNTWWYISLFLTAIINIAMLSVFVADRHFTECVWCSHKHTHSLTQSINHSLTLTHALALFVYLIIYLSSNYLCIIYPWKLLSYFALFASIFFSNRYVPSRPSWFDPYLYFFGTLHIISSFFLVLDYFLTDTAVKVHSPI